MSNGDGDTLLILGVAAAFLVLLSLWFAILAWVVLLLEDKYYTRRRKKGKT